MEAVVTLILVGAVLLFLETVLPGMIAGTFGIISLAAGVVMAYVNFGAQTGNLVLLGVVVGLIVGTLLWMKYLPGSRLARRFISERTVGEIGTEKPELLHQVGVAYTTLRPSGTAVINGQRVDVVTEGPFLERGTPLKVVGIEGMRVVVRAQPQADAHPVQPTQLSSTPIP
jgi:membrane-bound serine protease (ClpP class)